MKLKIRKPEKNRGVGSIWLTMMALLFAGLFLASCSENDDVPPVLTMNGQDTLFHVLNSAYNDPGATAIDDTEGNISDKIYVDNQVDIDRVGEYSVNYRVVDESGNESPTLTRVVYVYNQGVDYYGDYFAEDIEVYPGQSICNYPSYIWIDSTLNFRIVFLDFACSSKRTVYADVIDTIIIMPFQLVQDSVYNMSLQGAGTINDTMVSLEYTKIESGTTSYWNASFTRVK